MNLIILLILLATTFYSFWRDKSQYDDFKKVSSTTERLQFFKSWTIEPFLLYGVSSLLILWYIGHLGSLLEMPDFLKVFIDSITTSLEEIGSSFLRSMLKGIIISIVPFLLFGTIFGTILFEYQNHKKIITNADQEPKFRNLEPMIPKNYPERIWGFILSLNAGFSEEIFFRLMLPILIYSVSESIPLAILGSTIWFGLGHFYQGVWGVVTTFLVGLLLFGVYQLTQSIWIAIIIHVVIDVNGLVLGPWLRERFYNKEPN